MSEATTCPDPSMEAAWRLLDRLDRLVLEERQNQARIAEALAEAQRIELHKSFGYASLAALSWSRYAYGRSKTYDFIAIAEGCRDLPATREAFRAGTLHWTKAKEIVKVATPENEHVWLQRGRVLSSRRLRALRKGEPDAVQRTITLSAEEAARYDQLLASLKDRLNLASDGLALLALLEEDPEATGARARARVVVTECGSCQEATTESRDGPVPLSRAQAEAMRCSGEVHDLRDPENPVTRTIPSRVYRRVLDRDRRRCSVPGCGHRSFLDVHHEDGWRRGHDPLRMLTLCGAHHAQRHAGWFRIEGDSPDFTFVLRDGTAIRDVFAVELGEPGALESERSDALAGDPLESERSDALAGDPRVSERSDALAGDPRESERSDALAGEPRESERSDALALEPIGGQSCQSAGAAPAVQLADQALRRLEMPRKERARRLRAAILAGTGESWTVEGLVRAALRAA